MQTNLDGGRLASLQARLMKEMVNGEATLDHLDWFAHLSRRERDAISQVDLGDLAAPPRRFWPMSDLGAIVVPKNYDSVYLARFSKRNSRRFWRYDKNLAQENFAIPSRILRPGERLRVKAFRQLLPPFASYERRMRFLQKQKALYLGAQGAALVFEQKRSKLQKGFWYVSLDKEERLWRGQDGCYRVPALNACMSGRYAFDLKNIHELWDEHSVLLCFYEEGDGGPASLAA